MEDFTHIASNQSPANPQGMESNSPVRSVSPRAGATSVSSASSATSPPGRFSRAPNVARDDEDDWGDNMFDTRASTSFSKLSIQDVASDIEALRQLMRKGSWRTVIEKVKEAMKRSMLLSPDERLMYRTYHVLALMKVRNYGAAADELEALGDLDSPKYRFENHATVYSDKTGSMIPFGLRLLHAELPHRLGQTSTTIDRLYNLLAHCNLRIDFLQASAENKKENTVPTEGQVDSVACSLDKSLPLEDPGANDSLDMSRPQVDSTGAGDTVHDKLMVRQISDETAGPSIEQSRGLSERGPEADNLPLYSQNDDEMSSRLEDVGSNFIIADGSDDEFGEFVTSTAAADETVHSIVLNQWRRRQEVVLYSALSHHLNQKDYMVCVKWLEDLVRRRPHDALVLSKFGYVQMQLGDLYGARHTFAKVESLCEEGFLKDRNSMTANILARNRGLLYFSLKQYAKAGKEFDSVLERDPGDVVSANNKAICLMYSRDLVGATQVLENVLQKSPLTALNETLVLNLCSMYELASMNSTESKRTLSAWILRMAPDDFDLTCTRL